MKRLLASLCAVGFGLSLGAATQGSSEANARAITLSTTQLDVNVTLVTEEDEGWDDWDDDWGDDDWGDDDWGDDDWGDSGWFDSGVYYFKATLQKGRSYTIWMDGYDASSLDLNAYPYGEMEYETPSASFSSTEEQVDAKGVSHWISWMRAEDWESEDPNSWTYYFCLSGDVGQKTVFHALLGEKSYLPDGVADNPKKIVFTDTEKTEKYAITDENAYYFKADLTAGRKYLIRTTGGTAKTNVTLAAGASYELVTETDTAHQENYNAALAVYPKGSGSCTFVVKGPSSGAAFGIVYSSVPVRAIADHPVTALSENEPQVFKPGRLVADANYYDDIVDEQLFRFTAAKGERWILDATGADRAVEMRLYDAKGNILATNASVGDGTHDVRIGRDFDASGDYYVGVFDPSLKQTDAVVCAATTLVAYRVTPEEDEPVEMGVCAGGIADDPIEDGVATGPFVLDAARWTRTLSFNVRNGIAYKVKTALVSGSTALSLVATVFKYSGTRETVVQDLEDVDVTPGVYESQLKFTAKENATYYVRISVADGQGLDFPAFNVCSLGYSTATDKLGSLKVQIRGASEATWSIDSESVKYASGDTILAAGEHTVKFSKESGFSTPANETVSVKAGKEATLVVGTYSDSYDPKDDVYSGATKLSVSSSESSADRTLWGVDETGDVADEADWFVFTAKDGVYFNYRLDGLVGDAVFSIYAQKSGKPVAAPVEEAAGVTNVSKLVLGAGTFYLCVSHGTDANADSSYSLAASSANAGAIKFAKTAVSVKKNAGSVSLAVNRTSKEGRVRVRYETVAGTARPGERYVAQNGMLEWENGDSAARTIEIKLIPDLVAVYGGDTAFEVRLSALSDEELEDDEYPAQITADTCTVTVKETASKSVTTVEEAYAKVQPKVASVSTENTVLRAGTFFGVLAEDGSELTNGLPKLASVTLTTTVKAGKDDSLSAKVALAGKTYTFKSNSKDPEEWEELEDGYRRIVLTLVNKSPLSTNELAITVKDGSTTEEDAWLEAGGTAELTMTVPDAKGKGAQADIRYRGEIFRQNAKIDDYLKAVAETFYGYYTLALFPEAVATTDGIPAGNGYLTVKVDNKGTATVAGLLADGTKVSAKVTAAAIRKDAASANGYAMYLPVYQAKSPYCFGGTIRLTAKAGTTLPDEDFVRVVDSTATLVWNNDNVALTYYGDEGWRISCAPVGGWYDTIVNLEAYYLDYAISVGTADITEFPSEALASGYKYVTEVQPSGEAARFTNDALSTDKRSLVKVGKLYDLVASVNPCNVQVKLARATGIVTGSFSLWSENADGSAQTEIKNIKHNGVLLLARDGFAALDANALSAGYCSGSVTLKETTSAGKSTSRKWTYSLPFNLLGTELDATDPWAADGGWNPDWGEETSEL